MVNLKTSWGAACITPNANVPSNYARDIEISACRLDIRLGNEELGVRILLGTGKTEICQKFQF